MTFNETILFLKKLSFSKIINLAKRTFATITTHITKKNLIWGKPWSVSIEPSNICNLHCAECFTGMGLSNRKPKFITTQDFSYIINTIKNSTLNLFLYFQGEPYLNPHFTKLIAIAHHNKIFTVTSSNGHLINNINATQTVLAGLDKIIIPLDGYNQFSYSKYRKGGNFETVKKAITLISNAKKQQKKINPIIEVQCLASKITENNLNQIKQIAMQCGANKFVVKTMQIETKQGFETFLPNNQQLSRYTPQHKLKHPTMFCKRIYQSIVITSELDVLPCCYDKETLFSLGNLKQTSLNNILKDKKTIDFYNKILLNKQRPQMCNNCDG